MGSTGASSVEPWVWLVKQTNEFGHSKYRMFPTRNGMEAHLKSLKRDFERVARHVAAGQSYGYDLDTVEILKASPEWILEEVIRRDGNELKQKRII